MSTTKTEAKIFACTQSTEIGEDISKAFGVGLGKVSFYNFSDGEYQPSFEETIRGSRIFLIGSTHPTLKTLWNCYL